MMIHSAHESPEAAPYALDLRGQGKLPFLVDLVCMFELVPILYTAVDA